MTCLRFWNGEMVAEEREEKVSRLWSDMGRKEFEKLDRVQRWVTARSTVSPSV